MRHGRKFRKKTKNKRKIAKHPDFPIVSFLSQLMLFIYKSKQAQWIEMTKKTHIHKIGKSIYMPLLSKVLVPSWTGVSQEMTLHRRSEWWIFDDTLCTQYALKLQMSVFSRVDDENIDCHGCAASGYIFIFALLQWRLYSIHFTGGNVALQQSYMAAFLNLEISWVFYKVVND